MQLSRWINKSGADKLGVDRSKIEKAGVNRTKLKTTAEKLWNMPLVDVAVGGALCSLASVGMIAAAEGHSWKNLAPLIFTVVLLATAIFFGARAGILGHRPGGFVFRHVLIRSNGKSHCDQ